MLILTRRPVETIYIGDEVTVTVLGVVGNQVRFGIEAPRSIVIDRAEIHERKKRAALANGNVSGPNGSPPLGSSSLASTSGLPLANGSHEHPHEPDDETIDREVNGNVAPERVATLKLRR
jgi:carbon storage regulator